MNYSETNKIESENNNNLTPEIVLSSSYLENKSPNIYPTTTTTNVNTRNKSISYQLPEHLSYNNKYICTYTSYLKKYSHLLIQLTPQELYYFEKLYPFIDNITIIEKSIQELSWILKINDDELVNMISKISFLYIVKQ